MRSPANERSSQRFRQTRRFKSEALSLGQQVRQLRQQRSWTLEEMAERADLDLKHLQKVEAGQLNVTLVTLVRIAAGLEISMGDLFPRRRAAR